MFAPITVTALSYCWSKFLLFHETSKLCCTGIKCTKVHHEMYSLLMHTLVYKYCIYGHTYKIYNETIRNLLFPCLSLNQWFILKINPHTALEVHALLMVWLYAWKPVTNGIHLIWWSIICLFTKLKSPLVLSCTSQGWAKQNFYITIIIIIILWENNQYHFYIKST